MPDVRKRPHLILWGLGDFGQKAAVFFLAMKAARGGALTIVVPRRDQWLFENATPVVPEWRHFATVKEALVGAGQSVRVLYDDQTSLLCRSVVEQRTTGSHMVVGYVTAAAADHLVVAQVLVELCDRVIVEKPLTNSLDDLAGFEALDKRAKKLMCLLVGAEHYLLRPAALRAGLHAHNGRKPATHHEARWLRDFLVNHRECHLTYEFVFAEAGVAADATRRPGAFDDGAGLDVAVTHGLGALVKVCSALDVTLEDIAAQPYTVLPWKAVDESGARVTASVAETAIELRWVIPENTSRGARTILLRSGKFFKRPDRYWRVFCDNAQECGVRKAWRAVKLDDWGGLTGSAKLLYGASLGPDGTTYVDVKKKRKAVGIAAREAILRRNEFGGYRSDRTDRQDPEAHNAQAALIETMFEPKLPEDDPRVLSIPEAVGITRIALAVQQAALGRPQQAYPVGKIAQEVFQLEMGRPGQALEVGIVAEAPGTAGPLTRATYRADEGGGRTELARVLADALGRGTPIIDIPRHPTSTPDADALVASEIVTEIANAVGVAILPTADVERVLASIPRPEEGRFNLVLNGIDRVPSREWPRVARVLDLVSPHVRAIAATTSHGGRSIGATVRAPEDVAKVWQANALDCDGASIDGAIALASGGNIELARMIDAYWRHCSPEDYRKPRSAESVIAALCLPTTLLPSTARQRLRVARAIVGEMDPAARAELVTLAEVGGRVAVPKGSGSIEAGYSWIDARIDPRTCAIPSPIRQVLLSRDWLACEQVAADVRARLALLRDHALLSPTGDAAEAPGPERVAATERHVLVERLLRMPLGDIPFDDLFGALVLDLARAIDRKIAGFDKDCLAAQRLLKRLVDPARGQEVALPPLLLARLSTMYARVSLDLAAMAGDVNDTTLLGAAALDRHTAAAFLAQWSALQATRTGCPNAWKTDLKPDDTVAYAYATLRMERIGCGGGRPRLIAKLSGKENPIRVRPSRALWMKEGSGQGSPAPLPWKLDGGRVVFDRILNEVVRKPDAFTSKTRAVLLRAGAWDRLVEPTFQPAAAGGSDPSPASGSGVNASPATSLPPPAELLRRAAVAEREFAEGSDKDCEYAERAEAEAKFLTPKQAPPQDLQQTRGASEVGRAYAEVLETLVGGRLPAVDVTERLRRLGLYGLLDTVDCLRRAWIPPTAQRPPPPANR